MTYIRYEYQIFKFKTPRHYVAQVAEINHEAGECQTWCYTAQDIRTLVTMGTEPIRIALVHGTTRAWFDSIVNPKAIAIVGSRGYQNKQAIFDYVQTLPPNTTIVSGGARGVDTWAEEAARARGLNTLIFPAEWDKWGKSAGFRRNADIVNACDELVAWWCKNPETGKYSKGTKNSIDKAISLGKPVRIFIPKGSEANELPRIYLEYMEAA